VSDPAGKAGVILERFAAVAAAPGTALAKRHLSASYLAASLTAELGHRDAARALADEVERFHAALELVLVAERRTREPPPPGVL
jgi:hypothetical protein